jgi:hypothetical protein
MKSILCCNFYRKERNLTGCEKPNVDQKCLEHVQRDMMGGDKTRSGDAEGRNDINEITDFQIVIFLISSSLKSTIFWILMPCSLEKAQRFGGTY